MEHKSLKQIRGMAERHSNRLQSRLLSKRERLQRWIELLERIPTRILMTLPVTEEAAPEARDRMRRVNSAITVAHRDLVLRGQGLDDDTYGAARRFFGLSHDELHAVVCYCRHGTIMTARQAAWHLRRVARQPRNSGVLAGLWGFLTGAERNPAQLLLHERRSRIRSEGRSGRSVRPSSSSRRQRPRLTRLRMVPTAQSQAAAASR